MCGAAGDESNAAGMGSGGWMWAGRTGSVGRGLWTGGCRVRWPVYQCPASVVVGLTGALVVMDEIDERLGQVARAVNGAEGTGHGQASPLMMVWPSGFPAVAWGVNC